MFSALMPVYNHVKYLKQAAMSALRSRLVDELLLVDDGSTDGSAAVVAELAARYPGRVRDLSKPAQGNRGAHNRLNELVDAARSAWVAPLNSDDIFVDGRFDAVVAHERFRDSDFVFGNLLLIDTKGFFVGAKRGPFDTGTPFPATFDVERMVECGDSALDLLAHQNYLGTTSNMAFTKALHARIGGFAPYRYVHDWDFALRAMALGRCVYIRRYLTGYRIHPANTINESRAKVAIESKLLFDRLLRDFPHLAERPNFRVGLQHNPNLVSYQTATTATNGHQ